MFKEIQTNRGSLQIMNDDWVFVKREADKDLFNDNLKFCQMIDETKKFIEDRIKTCSNLKNIENKIIVGELKVILQILE